MTKRRAFGGILLLVMLLCAGCTGDPALPPSAPPTATPAAAVPTPVPTPEPEPSSTPRPDPVAERLSVMTLEEKVGQLFIAGFYGTTGGGYVNSLISDYQVGGLILYGRNVGTAAELVDLMNALRAQNGEYIPLFFSTDQEGGEVERMPREVMRLGDAYDYGKAGDPQVGYALGRTLAAECGAFGFNLNFAPSLDIWSNPDNTVIWRRAFGSDAAAVEAVGPWVAYGMAEGGVIPTVKHFPGHGDTSVDSHVGLPSVDKGLDELWDCELLPFRSAIEGRAAGAELRPAGIPAVMAGHILMSQLDPERPATLSQAVITGLLRDKMGFDGLVLTDDLTMGAITQHYGLDEAAVLAVEAGCDVLLICHNEGDLAKAFDAVLEAVNTGRISEARIDESVYRILSVKEEFGLTNDPIPMPDLDALNELISQTQPS